MKSEKAKREEEEEEDMVRSSQKVKRERKGRRLPNGHRGQRSQTRV